MASSTELDLLTYNTVFKITGSVCFTLIHWPDAECTCFVLFLSIEFSHQPESTFIRLHPSTIPFPQVWFWDTLLWTKQVYTKSAIFVKVHSEKLLVWGIPWKTWVDRTINEGKSKTELPKSIPYFHFFSKVSSFIFQYSVSA